MHPDTNTITDFSQAGEYSLGHFTVIAAFQEKRQHVHLVPPLERSARQCELGGTKKQKQSLNKMSKEYCMSSQRNWLSCKKQKKTMGNEQ